MSTATQTNTSKGQKVKASIDKLLNAEPDDVPVKTLARSWENFSKEKHTEGERIAFELQRGEVGMLVSRPNAGKTTLTLNVGLSASVGQAFSVLVEAGKYRKVLFVDGETRAARLQTDLRWLMKDFTEAQKLLVKENFHVICDAEIKDQSLSLTNPEHFAALQNEVNRIKPDLIILDTKASLFHVFNENDNGESERRVWMPLKKMARQSEATILVTHHIGKRQSEEGNTPDKMYLGRGDSASAGAARAVWVLEVDKTTKTVTLTLAKAKGKAEFETKLQLDESRWFRELHSISTKTDYEILREKVTTELTKQEIVDLMEGVARVRRVEKILAQCLSAGHLERGVARGSYRPVMHSFARIPDSA